MTFSGSIRSAPWQRNQDCRAISFSQKALPCSKEKASLYSSTEKANAPSVKKFRYADNFSEGLAVVQPLRSIKRGFIDTRGHLVIDAIYDDARGFSDQVAAVRVDPDEFFKIYNENGTPKDGSKKKPEESDEDGDDRDEDGEKIEPKDGEAAHEEDTKSDTDAEKSEKSEKSEASDKSVKNKDADSEKTEKSDKAEKPAKSEKSEKSEKAEKADKEKE